MTSEERYALQAFVGIVIAIAAISCVVSTAYLWGVYLRAPVRSRLFRVFAVTAGLITLGGLLLMTPVVLAIRRVPRLEEPLNLVLVGIGITAPLLAPSVKAGYVWTIRRAAGREDPPRRVPPPTDRD